MIKEDRRDDDDDDGDDGEEEEDEARSLTDPACDDPHEARYIEVDRRVKLYGAPDQVEWMKTLSQTVEPDFEHCDFCKDMPPGEAPPCRYCQVQLWVAELLRATATLVAAGSDPDVKKDPELMTGAKLSAFFMAIQNTCEKYPVEARLMGEKIRDRVMHPRCRAAIRKQKDKDACDMCGLAIVLSGGLLHVGRSL